MMYCRRCNNTHWERTKPQGLLERLASLRLQRPYRIWLDLFEFQTVEDLDAQSKRTPQKQRDEMPPLRRTRSAIPQAWDREAAVLYENLSMLRMRNAFSQIQTRIASAARSPVVTAPSIKGPIK